jgi:hypothetical protein
MVFVVFVSSYIFFGLDDVRNCIGKCYIEGYRHWTIETGENDNGEMTYGQDWTADTASGRRLISILQGILFVLAIVCPVVTWKALESAIRQRERQEQECLSEIKQASERRS